jgi:hypothetical protein
MDDIVSCCIGIIYLNDVSASVYSELPTARARTLALHNSDATGFDMKGRSAIASNSPPSYLLNINRIANVLLHLNFDTVGICRAILLQDI